MLVSLNENQWFQIEKKLSDTTIALLNTLIKYAKQGVLINQDDTKRVYTEQRVIGELWDINVRDVLVERKVLEKKPKPVLQKKNKIDTMRIAKTYEQIDNALKTYMNKNTSFFEINFIQLFLVADNFIATKTSVDKDTIGVSVAIQNAINISSNYNGICAINPTLNKTVSITFLEDLKTLYDKFNTQFPFDGLLLLRDAPELLIDPTKYHKITNTIQITPYDHQFKMLEYVQTHIKVHMPFFVFYSAPIGTGKTTTSVAIANTLYNSMKMIFVCTNHSVRIDVANQAYNTGTYFCVATLKNNSVKMTYQNRGSRPSNKTNTKLYICDPKVARIILENKNDYFSLGYDINIKNVIVFFDEPTIGANTINKDLYDTIFCHSLLPYGIIYSTATPPTISNMEQILVDRKTILKKHDVHTVSSDLVLIQSNVCIPDETNINPWNKCLTHEDIYNTIQTIKTNPFIARFLTAHGAITLYNMLLSVGIVNIPDIATFFKQFDNLKPEYIRDIIIQMLEILMNYPEHIQTVCDIKISKISKINTNDNIDFTNFNARMGMTLVGSSNPLNDAIKYFPDLPVIQCMEEIQRYTLAVDAYNILYTKMCKQSERSETKQDIQLIMTKHEYPKLILPQYKSYNVINNCEMIALLNSNAPDIVITLLLYGIVIHEPSKYDAIYMDTIFKLIASCAVRYVFSSTFAYGVNFPFTEIIIMPEYIEHTTMNTIMQLTGRAGRVNQSTRAKIIIPSDYAIKLLDFIKHPNVYSIEANNIKIAYGTLRLEYKDIYLLDTDNTDNTDNNQEVNAEEKTEETKETDNSCAVEINTEQIADSWED